LTVRRRAGRLRRFKVGIVGAGTAGLAAALTLRRHRVNVVVFDGGPSRNAWAREVHGYLGVSRVSGRQMRTRGLRQARSVGARVVSQCVERATEEQDGFRLETDQGRFHCDRLILATGVRDVYPDIERFFDFYGQSVFSCPHCDAYEVRDKPVAIVSWGAATLPFANTVRNWTKEITVVTDGRQPRLTSKEKKELADKGVDMITKTVTRFEGDDGQLTGLRFSDGSSLPVCAVFFNIGCRPETSIAQQLGCKLAKAGTIEVDAHLRTSVDCVWAAGDVAGEEQLVAVAAAHGVKAAIDVYRTLVNPP
jgi:thioredoxin reductase